MKGARLSDLDTPALLVDLPAMEANLATMAGFFQNRVRLRPHFKNHRVLALAARQIQFGATGITCARLWEAESLVAHGIKSILIANEIGGTTMVKRFAELSHQAPVIVAVDNAKVVDDLARAARNQRVEINVVVDVDVGLQRCGITPGPPVVALTKTVLEKGLKFRGLMGYEGHLQALVCGPEKDKAVRASLESLIQSRDLIESSGIPVEIVSCGGTGDYGIAGKIAGITENQAGSYLLMDTWYQPFASEFKLALSVLATVISKTPGERIVVDSGMKALSGEKGLPSVKNIEGLRVKALNAEHGVIELSDPNLKVDVGDKIEVWAHYQDATVHLHQKMYGIRNGIVEEILDIEH